MGKKLPSKRPSSRRVKPDPGTTPVVFEYFDPAARTVAVAGDFNQGNPSARPLARDTGGRWAVSVKLSPGTYQYRFVVGGDRWVEDPLNNERAANTTERSTPFAWLQSNE